MVINHSIRGTQTAKKKDKTNWKGKIKFDFLNRNHRRGRSRHSTSKRASLHVANEVGGHDRGKHYYLLCCCYYCNVRYEKMRGYSSSGCTYTSEFHIEATQSWSPRWSSGYPRMRLVLVLEFESRRVEVFNLLAKIKKDQLLRAPSVGTHNST